LLVALWYGGDCPEIYAGSAKRRRIEGCVDGHVHGADLNSRSLQSVCAWHAFTANLTASFRRYHTWSPGSSPADLIPTSAHPYSGRTATPAPAASISSVIPEKK
jgi:hypothetical protein